VAAPETGAATIAAPAGTAALPVTAGNIGAGAFLVAAAYRPAHLRPRPVAG